METLLPRMSCAPRAQGCTDGAQNLLKREKQTFPRVPRRVKMQDFAPSTLREEKGVDEPGPPQWELGGSGQNPRGYVISE
jgi:hypothetical protein